jgi:small GTP-binding protein
MCRFCDDQFSEEYLPTYESTYLTSVRHRNEEIDMRITDTQGQDDQDLFRNEYCLGTHGYVLVYSVNSHRSLEKLKSLNTKLINLMGTENVPRVLVGNKIDMDDDGERCVLDSFCCLTQTICTHILASQTGVHGGRSEVGSALGLPLSRVLCKIG